MLITTQWHHEAQLTLYRQPIWRKVDTQDFNACLELRVLLVLGEAPWMELPNKLCCGAPIHSQVFYVATLIRWKEWDDGWHGICKHQLQTAETYQEEFQIRHESNLCLLKGPIKLKRNRFFLFSETTAEYTVSECNNVQNYHERVNQPAFCGILHQIRNSTPLCQSWKGHLLFSAEIWHR